MLKDKFGVSGHEKSVSNPAIDRDIGERLRRAGHIQENEDLTVLYDRWLFVQASRGYRFGIDSIVLARYAINTISREPDPGWFSGARPDTLKPDPGWFFSRFPSDGSCPAEVPSVPSGTRVLDIGTGCGVVGIVVASELSGVEVTGVELQSAQVDRARRNVALNGLSCRFTLVEADIVAYSARPHGHRFELIVSNPPFYRFGSGRINPDGEKAISRHEIRLDMSGLLSSVSRLLSDTGRAIVLYPAERFQECLSTASSFALDPVRVVPLLAEPEAAVESYLVELARHQSGQIVETGFSDPMYLARDLLQW